MLLFFYFQCTAALSQELNKQIYLPNHSCTLSNYPDSLAFITLYCSHNLFPGESKLCIQGQETNPGYFWISSVKGLLSTRSCPSAKQGLTELFHILKQNNITKIGLNDNSEYLLFRTAEPDLSANFWVRSQIIDLFSRNSFPRSYYSSLGYAFILII